MPSEIVELRGHVIDSLLLPKVLDEITAHGGTFEVEDLTVGRRREDLSHVRLRIQADSEERLSEILARIQVDGAVIPDLQEVELRRAPADGVFPEHFHVTTNHPTRVRQGGRWLPVRPVRMDCGIVVDPEAGEARAVRFPQLRQGDRVVVGHHGVRVEPERQDGRRADPFEFMRSDVSAEKPKGVAVQAIAAAMRDARAAGERLLLVAGPAVIHTGAAPHVVRLIELGYVDLLFAGNALAVHDIERVLYGTSLGVDLRQGQPVTAGHQHHLHTINRIRGAGGIAAAVEQGIVTGGIMHACVRRGVEFVLAGSVRDDGPLPEVITDVVQAQLAMAERVAGVGFALVVATMLHGIATGNLLPASCRLACVDINPTVVTKLADRGSFQAVGVVTDVEPFFHELLACLEAGDGAVTP